VEWNTKRKEKDEEQKFGERHRTGAGMRGRETVVIFYTKTAIRQVKLKSF